MNKRFCPCFDRQPLDQQSESQKQQELLTSSEMVTSSEHCEPPTESVSDRTPETWNSNSPVVAQEINSVPVTSDIKTNLEKVVSKDNNSNEVALHNDGMGDFENETFNLSLDEACVPGEELPELNSSYFNSSFNPSFNSSIFSFNLSDEDNALFSPTMPVRSSHEIEEKHKSDSSSSHISADYNTATKSCEVAEDSSDCSHNVSVMSMESWRVVPGGEDNTDDRKVPTITLRKYKVAP